MQVYRYTQELKKSSVVPLGVRVCCTHTSRGRGGCLVSEAVQLHLLPLPSTEALVGGEMRLHWAREETTPLEQGAAGSPPCPCPCPCPPPSPLSTHHRRSSLTRWSQRRPTHTYTACPPPPPPHTRYIKGGAPSDVSCISCCITLLFAYRTAPALSMHVLGSSCCF